MEPWLLLGRPGPVEIGIIVLVIILIFGASKIPELARSMGQAKGEFKKGLQEGEQEAKEMAEDDEAEDEDEDAKETTA